ncbi:melanopsin-A-like [Apostichopus japonicus]|uniref:melanopsin-A-like n=1 Tax=Stichopus japonicus TaxID=307972 RepID=UPI003AB51045
METIFDYYNNSHTDLTYNHPRSLRIFDGVMHLTAGFLGVIGNTMVFIAFVISKRLQTKTNIFVVNLAFADFLTCILMPIFTWSLIADLDQEVDQWFDTMCAFAIGIAQGSVGCSLLTLSFIAMNRLVLITQTKETYTRIYRGRNVALFILIAWLYPITSAMVPLFFNIGELGYDEVAHICGTKTSHPQSYLYDVLVVVLLIPVPMVIIIYSYARIFYFISVHNNQLRSHQAGVSSVSGMNQQTNGPANSHGLNNRRLKKQVDISKNLFYVIVTYLICLTPHLLAEIFDAKSIVITQTKVLVVSNSFVNPILYGVKHPHFRLVFACILRCRWQDVPQPSWILKATSNLHSKTQGRSDGKLEAKSSGKDGPTTTL